MQAASATEGLGGPCTSHDRDHAHATLRPGLQWPLHCLADRDSQDSAPAAGPLGRAAAAQGDRGH